MTTIGVPTNGTYQVDDLPKSKRPIAATLMSWGTLSALPAPVALAVIALLIGISWGVTIPLGGAGVVAPHWFYLPIFMAGLRFGPLGALIAGGASMYVAGPLLPLSYNPTVAQATSDWVSRGIFFIVIGQFVTLLFIAVRKQSQAESVAQARIREVTAAQAALVSRERYAAVGEMATVIGHELRNPLGAAINLLFLARSRLTDHDDPELEGYLDRTEHETHRAAALSEDLTSFMRERLSEIVLIDFAFLVSEVLEAIPPPTGVEVSVEGRGVDLHGDRAQVTQMITRLVTNAYQAMPDGGTLRVTGSQSDGFVEITVEDTGAGIDPAAAEQIMEPFFTTKATGTGLGLAIVKRFAEDHKGTVSIANRPTGGAQVTLRLPRATPQAVP
jgi:signal transduction histidine kinase